MANITTTSAAAVIPEIWANTALSALRSKIVLARRILRDTEIDASASEGSSVSVSVPGTFVATTKAANTAVVLQTPTDAKINILLDKHREVSFLIEDPARMQSKPAVLAARMGNAMIPLANAVEDSLFALYTGIATSIGTSGTDIPRATLLTARKTLNDASAPEEGRFVVLSTKDEVALLGDTTLATYFANTQPGAFAEGAIGRLYGFDIFASNRVPVVAGAPNSTKNIAGTPEVAVMAMRGMPTDGVGVDQSVVTDPESGIAIRQTISYNASQLGWQFTYDILWGVAELRDACGVVVLS